jgi:hypothetical protein
MIDAILTNTLMPELARLILNAQLEGREFDKVTVSGGDTGFEYSFE